MQVTDPRALRALAHPLRLDLIELLGTAGPLTAAECARRLESTQASCSYHLRQLAKYGYVAEASARDDSRERPWQLIDIRQSWAASDPAAAELERVFAQREADRIIAWQDARRDQDETWRDAAFLTGASVALTPAELESVRAAMEAVIEPYVGRLDGSEAPPDGYRFVRVLLAATPATESAS